MFKTLASFAICVVVMTCDMYFIVEHLWEWNSVFGTLEFEPLVILNLFWVVLFTWPDKFPK